MVITKDTAVSLGVVAMVAAAAWWASGMQSDMTAVKQDVSAIKGAIIDRQAVIQAPQPYAYAPQD